MHSQSSLQEGPLGLLGVKSPSYPTSPRAIHQQACQPCLQTTPCPLPSTACRVSRGGPSGPSLGPFPHDVWSDKHLGLAFKMHIWPCPFPSCDSIKPSPTTCSVEYKSTSAFLFSPLALPASLQPRPPTLVTLPRPHQHSLLLHQAEHSLISEPPHRPLPVPEIFFASLPAWLTPPAGLSSNLFFSLKYSWFTILC